MSKLGRYAANRFKVEALSSNKTIEAADCGTMFLYTETAAFDTIQLPTVAAAGAGWWCRIVVTAMAGGANVDCNIAQSTDDTDDLVVVRYLDGTGGAVTQTAGDGVTIIGDAAVAGDYVELWCDGTTWHGVAVCSASGGLLKYGA